MPSEKKTITIEIDETTIAALNNALIAVGEVYFALILGCEVPSKLEPLKKLSDKQIQCRLDSISNLYRDIEKKYFI